MLLPVSTNTNGNMMWMVTTSFDKLTEDNKKKYLVEDGTVYELPKGYNVECYINSVDKKCYKPGEKVKITTSVNFEAQFKTNKSFYINNWRY